MVRTLASLWSKARARASCTKCFKEATFRVDGKYRNHREATDYRCADHVPSTDWPNRPVGSWAFLGLSSTMFKIETIEKLP